MPKADEEKVALFRYGVISDLVTGQVRSGHRERWIREKCKQLWDIPGKGVHRIGRSTIRDWINMYEQGGFEALRPVPRRDRGQCRKLRAEVVERIVQLREDRPTRSVPTILKIVAHEGLIGPGDRIAPSTVYRLLKARGLSGRRPDGREGVDRRRFVFPHAGDLWQADAMYGPYLTLPGRKRKARTYLIGLMDDATRVVPHAAFFASENLYSFLAVFRAALAKRGIPRRLFVDNGKAFTNLQIERICAELGVALIRARPYSSQSKGKIERFWATVRARFLTEVDLDGIEGLDQLNRLLWAWLEMDYHRTPHRSLENRSTPLDAWMRQADCLRTVDGRIDLETIFLHTAERRVYDDRTLHLHGRLYEAPAELVGTKVQVRYDPERPEAPIRLFHKGRQVGTARCVDPLGNRFVRRQRPDSGSPGHRRPAQKVHYVELLAKKVDSEQDTGDPPDDEKEQR